MTCDWDNSFKEHTTRSGILAIQTFLFTISYQLPEQQPHVWQAYHVAKILLSRLKQGPVVTVQI